ncbi:MAG: nicotinate-nucleotide adenylyltransferase [Paludibacteraceae bacterium]|nr:nicotinate-nucleotide adenylyltransferase [Paludibacteraceae bacterium]MBQ6963933.1 nicotinate-nucleotide adenylyltransferase [Paludibacteraceae bacterium]
MNKKVGIFCGSFNPIHNGHVALADYIARNSDLDEVWLVVSPLNPLKRTIADTLAPNEQRLDMVRLALRSCERLFASDIEFSLPLPNYTINTLNALKSKYPETDFSLIIGADNLALFERWKDSDVIMSNFNMLVYPRPGVDLDSLMQKYPKVRVLENAPLHDISSTEIRRRISSGESVSGLVNPEVEEYIKDKKLYL